MKKGQELWKRNELILAINLYCKLPFGRLHRTNPEVIKLAKILGRTSSAVAYKLVNFASLDPSLQQRGIKGASNTSKLDKEIWNEFYQNLNELAYESEILMAHFSNTSIEALSNISEYDLPHEGKTRDQLIKARVNQSFFRSMILASYNNTCCITGLCMPQFLVAGHIKPWSIDEGNRLNPRNGIAINALHDKAFETGLMSISTSYKIMISEAVLTLKKSINIEEYFIKYHDKEIILPSKFLPDLEFLKYHNEFRFQNSK